MQQQEDMPTAAPKRGLNLTVDFSKFDDIDPLIPQADTGVQFGRTSHNGVQDLVKEGILPPPLKHGGRNYWFLSQIKAGLAKLKSRQAAQTDPSQDQAAQAESTRDEAA